MEQIHRTSPRIVWLDAAKFTAIFTVLLNHTSGFLYDSDLISTFSACCIPLFVIIAGMTSYLSNQRHQMTWWTEFLHSSKSILAAYALATLIYQITDAADHGKPLLFDLETYILHLLRFDMEMIFYYVSLHLQLMLASRFLYRCIEGFPKRYRFLCEIAGGLLLLYFASFSIQYTNVLNLWGSGGKLFGGTCLFLYYLGMLLMKHGVFESVSRKKSLLFASITTLLLGLWLTLLLQLPTNIDLYFPFGNGYNPPGVSNSILALLVLFWVYGVFTLLQTLSVLRRFVAVVAFVGQHSLYIYLYQLFLLQYLFFRLPYIPLTAVVVLSSFIFLPIGFEYIVHIVIRFFRRLQRLDA